MRPLWELSRRAGGGHGRRRQSLGGQWLRPEMARASEAGRGKSPLPGSSPRSPAPRPPDVCLPAPRTRGAAAPRGAATESGAAFPTRSRPRVRAPPRADPGPRAHGSHRVPGPRRGTGPSARGRAWASRGREGRELRRRGRGERAKPGAPLRGPGRAGGGVSGAAAGALRVSSARSAPYRGGRKAGARRPGRHAPVFARGSGVCGRRRVTSLLPRPLIGCLRRRRSVFDLRRVRPTASRLACRGRGQARRPMGGGVVGGHGGAASGASEAPAAASAAAAAGVRSGRAALGRPAEGRPEEDQRAEAAAGALRPHRSQVL
ncbi:nucleosome assembly protein 1-like 4 isoform X5 [Mustela nigripes]|uniref:nucleosome assembly protein 1-like 4 isoform X5 n=1 Tax=Mustela nigripes TaxID=77151 RepID=UPI0028156E40|nr:nucleosome assembly protein 1-like 4 isoform X5 [Mustela nigripes]